MTEPWSKPTLLPAALAGLILCGCGAQKRVRTGACDAHRHVAALVTRYVVVYGSRAAPEAITTYYVCLRPAGKALDLGVDELGGLYGSDATTGGFYADGTYVAAQSSIGEATLAVCAQHSNIRRCTPDEHWITVLDTKNLRRARVPVYGSLLVPALVPFPVTLALSATGAVAWLESATAGVNVISKLRLWATLLTPRGDSGFTTAPTLIDAGSIDPSSVRLKERTLNWAREHERHRQKLH